MTLAGGGVVCFTLVSESKGAVSPTRSKTAGRRQQVREGDIPEGPWLLPPSPQGRSREIQTPNGRPSVPLPILSTDAQGSIAGVGFGTPLAQRSCRHS